MSEQLTSNFSEAILDQFVSSGFNSVLDIRKTSLEEFKATGLPTTKSEEYKFTHLSKRLEKDFKPYHFKKTEITDKQVVFHPLKDIEADHIVMVNGHFRKDLSTFKNAPTEILFGSLEDALTGKNDLVKSSFDNLRSTYKDPFSTLNSTFWNGGLFIQVSRGVQVKHPVVIYNLQDSINDSVVINSRILGMIDNNSTAQIIHVSENIGDNKVFDNCSEEFFVGESAAFSFYKIQNESKDIIQVNNTLIQQKASSKLSHGVFTLDGTMIRNNTTVVIDGENCESHLNGLYLLKGKTHVDNHSVVDHRKPNSYSNELYKGVLDDQSKGVFNGKIFVRPHAQKTNAFQSNRNILLTDTASINTKPQLEIWADDVKCSHGCTSGQLDEEALFYLQSRGIPKSTAKAMLLYAFANEVVEGISNEYLKTYLDNLFSEKLLKNF